MDLSSYLTQVRYRLVEAEGFLPAEAHLPPEVRPHVPAMLVHREHQDEVLAALIPADRLAPGAAAGLLEALAGVAERFAARGGCYMVGIFVFAEPAAPEEIDALRRLEGVDPEVGVTVLPWIADQQAGLIGRTTDHPALAALLRSLQFQEPAAERRRVAVQEPERPFVTYLVLGAIIALFALIAIQGGGIGATQDEQTLVNWGAAFRPSIWLEGEWWRLGSAAFLHFGPMHLLFNGLALYQLGRMVEWLFGHWRFALIFASAALAGSAASLYFNQPWVVSAGASGGLYGLFGALLFFRIASPLGSAFSWRQILTPIAINFLFTVTIPNIDAWNHFGGIAGGFVAAAIVGLPQLAGFAPARFALPQSLHVALATVLVGLSVLLLTGGVQVGGPGRAFVQGLDDLQERRYEAAEAKLREGARRWGDEWQPHYYLAVALASQGRLEEARAEVEWAIRLEPRARPARELYQWLEGQ